MIECTCEGPCRKIKKCQKDRKTGKYICHSCSSNFRYHNSRKREACSVCGRNRPVAVRTKSKKPVCPTCYYRARRQGKFSYEKCFECGRLKLVSIRTKDGKPVCGNCRVKDPVAHRQCSICRNVGEIVKRIGLKAICRCCWRNSRKGICKKCKERKIIKGRGMCGKCYQRQLVKEKKSSLISSKQKAP